jgi:hypothetical protein
MTGDKTVPGMCSSSQRANNGAAKEIRTAGPTLNASVPRGAT